jgi:hypothetical protein
MTKIDLVGSLIELREEYIYLYKRCLGLFNSYDSYEEYIPDLQRLYDVNELTNELGGKLFDTMIEDGTFFNHVYLDSEKENSDVILSPDQVPLDEMDYAYFNAPTKALIRQLLIAHAAETLGLIRGKFSGQIGMINNQLVLDYQTLLTMGQKERESAINELKERLQRMTPYETMKRQAELVQSMKEVQKGTPLGIYKI